MSFLSDMFSKKGLPKPLADAISKRLGYIENMEVHNKLSDKQKEYRDIGLRIQNRLNHFEAHENPRRDPALAGLRTDQWRVFYYTNYSKKQSRTTHQTFDYKYRFVIVNLQKPYRYKLDLTDYSYTLGGGKVFTNMPISAMTDKERKRMRSSGNWNHLPKGYTDITKNYNRFDYINDPSQGNKERFTYSQDTYKTRDEKRFKIRSRYRGTIGNLAAVRLSTTGNIVRPKYAKRIVFWVSRIRRMNNRGKSLQGRGLKTSGYVFVTARQYNTGGHDWYREQIEKIIKEEMGKYRFVDITW